MAGFANHTALKATILHWLARPELTAEVDDFITLAESEIDRVLRRTTARSTITIVEESTPLGATVAELRSIRILSTPNAPKIDIVTPEILADLRTRYVSAGRPRAAAIIDGNLVVVPEPDQLYDADMIAYSKLVPLSDDNPINIVLQESPDLYLYGALTHAAPFLKNDERVELWRTFFVTGLEQLEKSREREEHGANMGKMPLPTVFGKRP